MPDNQDKMLDWEDYDDKSSTYTALRKPVGLEDMLTFFSDGGRKDTKAMVLLDAGCGTGNYTVEFVRRASFKFIHAGDFNGGMLKEAKANLAAIPEMKAERKEKAVEFSRLNICDMKQIKDNSLDCSINCQVIHHLPKNQDVTAEMESQPGYAGPFRFERVREACKEWHRVLKPGSGKFVMNFVTHHQQMNTVWWGELIEGGVRRWQANAPDQEDIRDALIAAGFHPEDIEFRPVIANPFENAAGESLYDDELFLNPETFLDVQNFRRSDSTFTLATEDELVAAVERVKMMRDEGTLAEWFKSKEAYRARVGMTTNVYVTKGESGRKS